MGTIIAVRVIRFENGYGNFEPRTPEEKRQEHLRKKRQANIEYRQMQRIKRRMGK